MNNPSTQYNPHTIDKETISLNVENQSQSIIMTNIIWLDPWTHGIPTDCTHTTTNNVQIT